MLFRQTTAAVGRGEAPRVLLAEDDGAMRVLMSTALRLEGFRVSEARNGRDLLERVGSALLTGCPYDAVVTDVRMPGLSGLEVLRGLGGQDSGVPIILVTAFSTDRLRARARALGAWALIDKPFELETLTAVLRQAVDLHRRCAACGARVGPLRVDGRHAEVLYCPDCADASITILPPSELGVGD